MNSVECYDSISGISTEMLHLLDSRVGEAFRNWTKSSALCNDALPAILLYAWYRCMLRATPVNGNEAGLVEKAFGMPLYKKARLMK